MILFYCVWFLWQYLYSLTPLQAVISRNKYCYITTERKDKPVATGYPISKFKPLYVLGYDIFLFSEYNPGFGVLLMD